MADWSRVLRTAGAAGLRIAGAAGIKKYVNSSYGRYGMMTELKIDKDRRQIEATLMLKGESEPIHIVLKDYELTAAGDKSTLTFKTVTVSREWMAVIADEYLKDRPLSLPSIAAKALQALM